MEEDVSCKKLQRDEIHFLTGMFPNEIKFATEVEGKESYYLFSTFTLYLNIEENLLEFDVKLPQSYPMAEKPDVFIRSQTFQDSAMITDLRKWLDAQNFEVPLIFEAFCWIKDNSKNYLLSQRKNKNTHLTLIKPTDCFTRTYIRSHHIYSEEKRRKILSSGTQLQLNGFFAAGKPGVIVIEGCKTDCDTFYGCIKDLGWKEIRVQDEEKFIDKNELKLTPFKEVNATASDIKILLKNVGLEHKFNILYNL